jgi:CubicO group peptidase (beta-lactamase class C family)
MKQIEAYMQQGVSNGVFPGGVLLVSTYDSIVFKKAYGYADIFLKTPMVTDTIFDLASLTKPLATTMAVMKLTQDRKVDLDQHLGSILYVCKGTDKEKVTIRQLLCHSSGLPDYRPYYKTLVKLPVSQRKDALRKLLVKEPLLFSPGQTTLYSDLGFMVLCWVVERLSEKRLDRYVTEDIYAPMDIFERSGNGLFFNDLNSAPRSGNYAATECCPWRKIVLSGKVHDDNAYVLGGIEGHSGLFGTADDVLKLLLFLLNVFYEKSLTNMFDSALIHQFFMRQNNTAWALGFDTPSQIGSSSGKMFSRNTVGHLGYTGTSFWMDIDRCIIVILLTNRVHPVRDNDQIKKFRPKLHDMVMKKIL